jgi:acyl-CoA dehydrogenase
MSDFFELSEIEKTVVENIRRFVKNEIEPKVNELEKKKEFPITIIKKAGELGYCGILADEKYGGSNLGNFALCLILEEVNKISASIGTILAVQNSLVCEGLGCFGSEYLKEKYLPKLASGEWIGAYCLTEPQSGTDAFSLESFAQKKDGYYILNGTKSFVTNGAFADVFIVYAKTKNANEKKDSISAFVIEKNFKGIKISQEQEKLGLHCCSLVSVNFENCEIPETHLLGILNEGEKVAKNLFNSGRIATAIQAVGIAQRALELSIQFAKERTQFGKKISEFQSIQWKLAEMKTEIEAARILTYKAAKLRDKNIPHTLESSMAKLFASTIANKAVRNAVQIFGGAGYFEESIVARLFRDQKITEIYSGTSEAQKITIAKYLLESQ